MKPFLDHLNETESNELDILMVLSRKAEGVDETMTVRGKDGTEYPFKQFVKFVEDDGNGNYCATEDDSKEFGSKLVIALQNTCEYKYPPKFIFFGDSFYQNRYSHVSCLYFLLNVLLGFTMLLLY